MNVLKEFSIPNHTTNDDLLTASNEEKNTNFVSVISGRPEESVQQMNIDTTNTGDEILSNEDHANGDNGGAEDESLILLLEDFAKDNKIVKEIIQNTRKEDSSVSKSDALCDNIIRTGGAQTTIAGSSHNKKSETEKI